MPNADHAAPTVPICFGPADDTVTAEPTDDEVMAGLVEDVRTRTTERELARARAEALLDRVAIARGQHPAAARRYREAVARDEAAEKGGAR